MKFPMNGALTIGTLDGANIEIREEVGAENFFLFGLDGARGAPAAAPTATGRMRVVRDQRRAARGDRPHRETASSRAAIPQLFRPLIDNLLYHDPYLVLADFQSYADCQTAGCPTLWRDGERWTRMSILNSARSGKFSSDRTIREYCEDIWRVKSVPIRLMRPDDVTTGFIQ